MTAQRKPRSAAHWEALASQWAKHEQAFRAARTAREAIQHGMRLILLKEAVPHGQWRDRVNQLGLHAHTASKLMALARRFLDAPEVLVSAAGTASKLLELLPLDVGQVGVLCAGGAVHGLTLESMASMTVAELRAAVRAALEAEGRAVVATRPKAVRLTVEEERMLRLFRRCGDPARAALFNVAGLLAHA